MEKIVSILQSIWDFWEWISNAIVSIAWFLVSILWFLRYSWKTLLVWIYKLFLWVLNSWVFVNVSQAFLDLSDYIWIWAYFIYALLFVAIIRILIAFVFKILRRDADYKVRQTNRSKWREQTWEKHVSESEWEFAEWKHIFHW